MMGIDGKSKSDGALHSPLLGAVSFKDSKAFPAFLARCSRLGISVEDAEKLAVNPPQVKI